MSSEFIDMVYALSCGIDIGLGRMALATLYRRLIDAHVSLTEGHLDLFSDS